ncbi:MAG: hypothetical protein ACU0BB_10125 [Paracoccaceae bacterium]
MNDSNWAKLINPCSLSDYYFFLGIDAEQREMPSIAGGESLSDYYVVFRKYLEQKKEKKLGFFEPGSPGLVILGFSLTHTIEDEQKRKLYEAFAIHQLGVLHSSSFNSSGLPSGSVVEILDGFFLHKLKGTNITDLGTLMCAVEFDVIGVPLDEVINSLLVRNCVLENEG